MFLISRCGDLANFFCKLFLGRALDSVDFGAWEPILSVLMIPAIPITILFETATKSISRLRAKGYEDQCRGLMLDLIKLAGIGSVLGVGVVLLLRSFIMARLHLEDSPVHAVLFCILLVTSFWTPLYRSIVQARHQYGMMLVPAVVSPVLRLLLMIIFVGVLAWGLPGALGAQTVGGLLTVGAGFLMLRPVLRGKRASYREETPFFLKTLLPMAVFTCGMALLLHFDRLYVRNFMKADSGGYGAVITLGMIPTYLMSPVTFVVFPLAAARHATGRDLKGMRGKVLLLGLITTVLCACTFALFGRLVFGLWNPAFLPYAGLLWLYALSAGIHETVRTLASLELARNRYGFLWSILVPALIACGYLYARRAEADLVTVLVTLLVARSVALAGTCLSGFLVVAEKDCSKQA